MPGATDSRRPEVPGRYRAISVAFPRLPRRAGTGVAGSAHAKPKSSDLPEPDLGTTNRYCRRGRLQAWLPDSVFTTATGGGSGGVLPLAQRVFILCTGLEYLRVHHVLDIDSRAFPAQLQF